MFMELSARNILEGSKMGSNNSRLTAVIVFCTRTIEPTGSVIRKLHWGRMLSLVISVPSLEGHKIQYRMEIILPDLHSFSLPVGPFFTQKRSQF